MVPCAPRGTDARSLSVPPWFPRSSARSLSPNRSPPMQAQIGQCALLAVSLGRAVWGFQGPGEPRARRAFPAFPAPRAYTAPRPSTAAPTWPGEGGAWGAATGRLNPGSSGSRCWPRSSPLLPTPESPLHPRLALPPSGQLSYAPGQHPPFSARLAPSADPPSPPLGVPNFPSPQRALEARRPSQPHQAGGGCRRAR